MRLFVHRIMPNKRKLSKPMKRKRVTKRPRPDTSDSDDSDSTSPTVLQTEENALWSIPDTTTKLPEVLSCNHRRYRPGLFNPTPTS